MKLFSIVGLMDVSFSKGEERQEAGKHQQRNNSGVNSFLGPLVPLLLVNEEAGGREAPAKN